MLFDSPFLNCCLVFLLTFGLAYFAIPSIIFFAKKKRLFDEPDDFRKIHLAKTPNLGGVAIFAAFAFATSFLDSDKVLGSWNYIFAALLILFVTGLKDDVIGLSPLKKFLAQFLAAVIVVYLGDIRITDFHGIFGIHALPYSLSLAFTVVGCMFVTNAFNLIDGIDGLAGGIGLLVFSIFGGYFASVGSYGLAYMSFSMVGGLLAFLRYNIAPAKIFMGDTGSLLLGFIAAILSVKFVELNNTPLHSVGTGASSLVVALAILIIPVFDTFRVFVNRLYNGRPPFTADRNHIHHLLLDIGLNHFQASGILVAVNISFITVAYCLKNLNPNIAIGVLLLLAIGLFRIPLWLKTHKLSTLPAVPVPKRIVAEPLPKNEVSQVKKEMESPVMSGVI
ncbi:MAG TPA: MraY family glycosyltransferase [Chitinophagaceae bacterium]